MADYLVEVPVIQATQSGVRLPEISAFIFARATECYCQEGRLHAYQAIHGDGREIGSQLRIRQNLLVESRGN